MGEAPPLQNKTQLVSSSTLSPFLTREPEVHATPTASFHNFKSQSFKLSVSNPKSKYVAYVSVLSQISNSQGLGRKNNFEILKTYRMKGIRLKGGSWRRMYAPRLTPQKGVPKLIIQYFYIQLSGASFTVFFSIGCILNEMKQTYLRTRNHRVADNLVSCCKCRAESDDDSLPLPRRRRSGCRSSPDRSNS